MTHLVAMESTTAGHYTGLTLHWEFFKFDELSYLTASVNIKYFIFVIWKIAGYLKMVNYTFVNVYIHPSNFNLPSSFLEVICLY